MYNLYAYNLNAIFNIKVFLIEDQGKLTQHARFYTMITHMLEVFDLILAAMLLFISLILLNKLALLFFAMKRLLRHL